MKSFGGSPPPFPVLTILLTPLHPSPFFYSFPFFPFSLFYCCMLLLFFYTMSSPPLLPRAPLDTSHSYQSTEEQAVKILTLMGNKWRIRGVMTTYIIRHHFPKNSDLHCAHTAVFAACCLGRLPDVISAWVYVPSTATPFHDFFTPVCSSRPFQSVNLGCYTFLFFVFNAASYRICLLSFGYFFHSHIFSPK